ncbi:hypothetical protein LEP1GSC062_4163 [Leptospira alexanderi serovar Manhao 3 str. L 60]|uniref:Uncharacterized protein n=1 Tax=Leptospira alexanderi serovar Manhao 3 str. L 60 TaxID=1049759 RepID=V6I6U3_9LEPT|nr:hypothetical protein LEP1GSC062_4163 [Leptospira alexanderi serovar Manhao 3 str. L 60]
MQHKIFILFSVLLFLISIETLFAKATLRLKVVVGSKTDPPAEIWVRGNGYSKVFSFSNQSSEFIVDLKEQGVYDVVLTYKSGAMEQKTITVDSDEKNLDFVQKQKVVAGINVVGKDRILPQTIR